MEFRTLERKEYPTLDERQIQPAQSCGLGEISLPGQESHSLLILKGSLKQSDWEFHRHELVQLARWLLENLDPTPKQEILRALKRLEAGVIGDRQQLGDS